MNIKKIVFFLLVIFILVSYSQINAEPSRRYDPFLGGVLSWYTAGLGQFYSGQYLKGTIFGLVDNTLLISTILTVADITFSINKDIGFQFSIKPKENITSAQKTVAITLLISYTFFHIYNVIDAVQSIKTINKKLLSSDNKVSFSYAFDESNNYFKLNYKF